MATVISNEQRELNVEIFQVFEGETKRAIAKRLNIHRHRFERISRESNPTPMTLAEYFKVKRILKEELKCQKIIKQQLSKLGLQQKKTVVLI